MLQPVLRGQVHAVAQRASDSSAPLVTQLLPASLLLALSVCSQQTELCSLLMQCPIKSQGVM